MNNLEFSYDSVADVLTVEGQRYSGELFRQWAANGLPTERWFKLVRTSDGGIGFYAPNTDEDRDLILARAESEAVDAINSGDWETYCASDIVERLVAAAQEAVLIR